VGLKQDSWIREKAINEGMIEPFVEALNTKGVVSYGLSSYEYEYQYGFVSAKHGETGYYHRNKQKRGTP
jgi:hypothetical protein